jgi:hypothetical protein
VSDVATRLAWVLVVLGAGAALTRGLLQTTYFELTPAAQEAAEGGRLWLWAGTAALLGATAVAAARWRVSAWTLGAVAVAGPVALLVEGLGWLPPVALVVVVPLLLVGLTGVLLAPRRDPGEDASGTGPPLRS